MCVCPKCGADGKITDTRMHGQVRRRRRECVKCEVRWSTWETNTNFDRFSAGTEEVVLKAEKAIKAVRTELQKRLNGAAMEAMKGVQPLSKLKE